MNICLFFRKCTLRTLVQFLHVKPQTTRTLMEPPETRTKSTPHSKSLTRLSRLRAEHEHRKDNKNQIKLIFLVWVKSQAKKRWCSRCRVASSHKAGQASFCIFVKNSCICHISSQNKIFLKAQRRLWCIHHTFYVWLIFRKTPFTQHQVGLETALELNNLSYLIKTLGRSVENQWIKRSTTHKYPSQQLYISKTSSVQLMFVKQ